MQSIINDTGILNSLGAYSYSKYYLNGDCVEHQGMGKTISMWQNNDDDDILCSAAVVEETSYSCKQSFIICIHCILFLGIRCDRISASNIKLKDIDVTQSWMYGIGQLAI